MRHFYLILVLALSACVFAQAPPDPKALALEQAFADAEQHHDLAWIQQHVLDNAVIFNGAGGRSSKQELLSLLPNIHLAKYDMSDISTLEVSTGRVLVAYTVDIVTSYGDLPAAAYRFRVSTMWDTVGEAMMFHQTSFALSEPPTVDQFEAMERKVIKAEADRDVATMSVLLSEDSISVGGTGQRLTKQDVLQLLPKVPPHEPEASNFAIIPLGFDGVMVNYRLRSTEMRNGVPKLRLYTVTSLWRRNPDGKWQVVYHQGTENPQPLGMPEK